MVGYIGCGEWFWALYKNSSKNGYHCSLATATLGMISLYQYWCISFWTWSVGLQKGETNLNIYKTTLQSSLKAQHWNQRICNMGQGTTVTDCLEPFHSIVKRYVFIWFNFTSIPRIYIYINFRAKRRRFMVFRCQQQQIRSLLIGFHLQV